MAQPLAINHIRLAGLMLQQADQYVTTVLAGAPIGEHHSGYAGQAHRVVQLAKGQQARIAEMQLSRKAPPGGEGGYQCCHYVPNLETLSTAVVTAVVNSRNAGSVPLCRQLPWGS